MYKIVIVEDEDLIRKGLEYAIPWADMDCTVVGSGRNGIEGIELIEKHHPDIVLADINMPVLDGLEMMKKTCREYCYSAIIISGYSSFEYAKSAIRWGATGYLLKPINREELYAAISEAKEQCEIKRTWIAHKRTREGLSDFHLDLDPVEPEADEVVQAMLNYVKKNYQKKIVLQDVVNELNYSVAFLNKRFKKQMGTTFIEYLNRFRVQKALELMKEGKASLQDISWMCGIGDYKYFNLVFKKYIGCSPKEYIVALKGRLG